MDRICDFLFEAGMLKRTPRSGWHFLGSGSESVAEHTFRTMIVAFALARLHGGDGVDDERPLDADRLLRMVLVHDLPEARTGDLNYVHQRYATVDEARAAEDLARGLPFGGEIVELIEEFEARETVEARLARDADNLEMLLSLKERLDSGAPAAREWIPPVLERLQTDTARRLASRIVERDSADWWFDRDSDWWTTRGR